MKIALFSPFCSQNYGTVLQAFSLSKILMDKGHSCNYIQWNYYNLTFWGRVKFLLNHPLYIYLRKQNIKLRSKDLSYSFLREERYSQIIKKNEQFCVNNIPHTKQKIAIDELSKIESEYDLFIVGSDQTWSPNALYQYSPYYLSFIKDNQKKASYASSIGTLKVPSSFQKHLKKELRSFRHLSCRENTNTILLEKLLGRSVTNVLDPTLLLKQNEWAPYFTRVETIAPKYILAYILGEKPEIRKYAEKLGQLLGIPVYYILTRPNYENEKNVLDNIGVQEFLWLIANAEYIVTDSFHATIFSINFERNFISFDKHSSNNSYDNGRLQEILNDLGLLSHYHDDNNMELPESINYKSVNKLLDIKRKSSMEYIEKIILG